MPLASFALFTGLGAGIWTAILAAIGFAIGRSTADITYLELCEKGKDMASAHLPLVVGGAVLLVALYFVASKLVMGKGARK
jgi:membrane protein DedA with SNARE-associated domain